MIAFDPNSIQYKYFLAWKKATALAKLLPSQAEFYLGAARMAYMLHLCYLMSERMETNAKS